VAGVVYVVFIGVPEFARERNRFSVAITTLAAEFSGAVDVAG